MERLVVAMLVAAFTAVPAQKEKVHRVQGANETPLRSVVGRRLSAPKSAEAAGMSGLTLDAVHTVDVGEGGAVHVRHPIAQPAQEEAPESGSGKGRRLYAGRTRRDFVRLLVQLNVLAYTSYSPAGELMKPILESGDSIFGASVATLVDETVKGDNAMKLRKEEVSSEGNVSVADGGLGLDTAPRESIGVHALEFSAPEVGKILVFRGSFSEGDHGNVKTWVAGWTNKKMSAMMKYQWVTEANLTWTQQMQDAKTQVDLIPSETIVSAGSWRGAVGFRSSLKKIAESKGLDVDKVGKTGYWEFTKVIADSVRSSLEPNQTLTISGHSQGGARAALVSMYFEKKYGEKYDTVTFAAIGGTCFSRDLDYTDGNMLLDVDPYVGHAQVTEYVHPLDVYGYLDYDVGNVCVYGMTGLAESKARKYCEMVFGHQGPDLMVAGSVPGTKELSEKFRRCRYFTHFSHAVHEMLMNDTFLDENGTTDGGCSPPRAIPKGDTRCPDAVVNMPDGCNDELSCKSCGISTSPLGLPCMWCDAEQKCRSTSTTWFSSCSSGWATCTVASPAAGLSPWRSVAVVAAAWSSLLLTMYSL